MRTLGCLVLTVGLLCASPSSGQVFPLDPMGTELDFDTVSGIITTQFPGVTFNNHTETLIAFDMDGNVELHLGPLGPGPLPEENDASLRHVSKVNTWDDTLAADLPGTRHGSLPLDRPPLLRAELWL